MIVHKPQDSGRDKFFTNTGVVNSNRSWIFFKSFSFVWGSIIFFCDIFAVSSAVFWLGAEGFPKGINLALVMIIEALLTTDFFLRLFAAKTRYGVFGFLQIYEKGTKLNALEGILNLISVIPHDLILSRIIDYSQKQSDMASYFEILKLLRIRSMRHYLKNIQDFLIHNNFRLLFAYALLKTFLNLLLFSHLAACLLMVMAKFQKSAHSTQELDRPLIEIYVDSMLWAICSMEGDNLGEFKPMTAFEITVTEFIMLFGAFFYAHIFGDFHEIISIKRKEFKERKKKFENCKEFCIERDISVGIRKKVKSYYTMDLILYNEVKNYMKLSQLPVSLRTEISLINNEDMIKNVKLFALSSPAFILSISKNMRPKFAMEGDLVLRVGEIANEFFFIQKGKVEIRATDNISTIATMEVGCYFGEIGLLITGRRTVSVHALTDCIFQTISKKMFEKVMSLYPDQKAFLMNVAKQRLKITTSENLLENSGITEMKRKDTKRLSIKYDSISRRSVNTLQATKLSALNHSLEVSANPQNLIIPIFSFSESEASLQMESRSPKGESMNTSKAFDEGLSMQHNQNFDLKSLIIYPTSWVFKIWFSIITLTCFYNLFYIPISIAFEINFNEGFLICDIICFSVYFLDFIFQSRISYKDNEDYIKKPDAILFNYFNHYFLTDLFSFLPLDYLVYLCGSPGTFMRWIRFMRLLKLVKLRKMEEVLEGTTEKLIPFQSLIKKVVFFIYLNHFFACLMYSVCIYCFKKSSHSSLIGAFNEHYLKDQIPFEEASIIVKYINFLYFSLGVASGGSYGDIHPHALEEKIAHILGLFIFPINFSFLAADFMEMASDSESALSDHLLKLDNIHQWMDHIKLPQKLKIRVARFNDHLWNKLKGINDHEILNDLPETLRNDILLFLFRNVLEKIKYFPKNDPGILLTLVKYLRINLSTKGEWICRSGEIAREMYFILDGQAIILNESDNKVLAVLKKGDYYGEMAVLSGKGSIRSASVRAITNISLASFTLEDFNLICEQYPIIYENIQHLSDDKQILQNERDDDKLLQNLTNSASQDDINNFKLKKEEGIIEELWTKSYKRKDSFLLSTPKASQIEARNFNISPKRSNSQNFSIQQSKLIPSKKGRNLTVMIPVLSTSAILESPDYDKSKLSRMQADQKISSEEQSKHQLSNDKTPINSNNNSASLNNLPLEHDDNISEGNSLFFKISQVSKVNITEGNSEGVVKNVLDEMNEPNLNSSLSSKKEPTSNNKKGIKEAIADSTIKGSVFENIFREEDFQVNPNDKATIEPFYMDSEFDELSRAEGPIPKNIVIVKTNLTYWVYQKLIKKASYSIRSFLNMCKTLKFWIFVMIFYNMIYVPLHLAFESYGLSSFFVFAEICCLLTFLADFFKLVNYIRRHRSSEHLEGKQDHGTIVLHGVLIKQLKKYWFSIIYKILHLIPFLLIFEAINLEGRRCNIALLLLQMIRITNVKGLVQILTLFKRRNIAFFNILQIILLYIIFAHVLACFYIVIAICENDFNNSWIRQIPSPEVYYETSELTDSDHDLTGEFPNEGALYLHALYWTYSTIAHIGFKDVLSLTIIEKTYCSFVILITTFITLYIFGNIASLAEKLTPILKSNYNKEYKSVMVFLKDSNLDSFREKLEKYFDYIWRADRGINENKILKDLPSSIRCDIQMHRYLPALQKGRIFKVEAGHEFNVKITYSLLKYMKYKIYMPEDIVFTAGVKVNKVYIVLEGSLVVCGFNLAVLKSLEPGDHFGYLEEDERQPYNVKASNISKIGIIKKKDFRVLCEAYPRWINKLKAENNTYTKQVLMELNYFSEKEFNDVKVDENLIQYYHENYEMQQEGGTLPESNGKVDFDSIGKAGEDEYELQLTNRGLKGKIDNNHSRNRGPNSLFESQNQLINKLRETVLFDKIILKSFKDLLSQPTWRSKYIILPHSGLKFKVDVLNLILILYNVLAVPLIIELNTVLLLLEIVYIIFAIFHVFLKLKTAKYVDGNLITNMKDLFLRYLKQEFFLDFVGVLPLVLIFANDKSIISSLARLLRVSQILLLKSAIIKIEHASRSNVRILTFLKAVSLLGIVWHLITCFWMWTNLYLEPDEDDNFYRVNQLDHSSVGFQYLVSSFFVINIVTTVGSEVALPQNDLEKCIFFVILYIGIGFFAISFGLVAANIQIFPEKFSELFESMKKINSIIEKKHIPQNLKWRTENYFSYVIDLKQRDNTNFLKTMRKKLPKKTFEEILTIQAKSLLLKLPILNEAKNSLLLQEIAKVLDIVVFLPNDFIIYKDDLGEEMYFIREGQVNVLSPNENQIIATLSKGDYFGEIAIFLAESRRICSVVAGSNYVQAYILKKKHIKNILEKFPSIEKKFRIEGQRRLEEYKAKEEALRRLNRLKKEEEESSYSSISEQTEDEEEKLNEGKDVKEEAKEDENQSEEEGKREEGDLRKASFSQMLKIAKKPQFPSGNKLSRSKSLNPSSSEFIQKRSDTFKPRKEKRRTTIASKSNSKKINRIAEVQTHKKEDANLQSFDELVEDDELVNDKIKKQSRRLKVRKMKGRRYSRINLGKEIILSSTSGLRLQWALN